MTRKRRMLLIIFIVLMIITVSIPLLINTKILNRIIKSKAEDILGSSIKGECRISNLKANLSYIEIDTLYLSNEHLISQVEQVRAGISIYSLLTGKILVNFIEIDDVFVNVKKMGEKIPPDTAAKESSDIRFYYEYPLKEFIFNVDIKTLKVNNAYIQYDTFSISNISVNSSISINKNRTVFFYNIISGKVDKFINIMPSRGEIVLNSDNVTMGGKILSKELNIQYDAFIHDSTIDLRKMNIDLQLDKSRILGIDYSGNAKLTIIGMFSSREHFISCNAHVQGLSIDTFNINTIDLSASLRNDSLIVEYVNIKDSLLDISGAGLMEITQFPVSEMNLNIGEFNSNYFHQLDGLDLSAEGNIGIKINSHSCFTVIADNLYGKMGKDSLKNVNGSFSYDNGMFYVNHMKAILNDGVMSVNGRIGRNEGNVNAVFSDFQLAHFYRIIDSEANVNGIIDGIIDMKGGYESPTASFNFQLSSLMYNDIEIDNIDLNGNITKGEDIPNIVMTAKVLNFNYKQIECPISYIEISKNEMNYYTRASIYSNLGLLEYEGDYVFDHKNIKLLGLIRMLSLSENKKNIYLSKPVYINIATDTLDISEIEIYGDDLYMSAGISMYKDSLSAFLTFKEDSMKLIKRFLPEDVSGYLNIHATALGYINNPSINLQLLGTGLTYELIELDTVDINLNYNERIITVNKCDINYNGFMTSINGEVFLNDLQSLDNDSLKLYVNAEHIDGSFFTPLYDIFTIDSGYADMSAIIKGNLSDPDITGEINVYNADAYIISIGTYVRNLNGKAVLTGDTLVLQSAAGETKNGKAEIYGKVYKRGITFDGYQFSLVANGVNVNGIDYLNANGDCRLNISGTATVPKITGYVFINDGVANMPLFSSQPAGVIQSNIDSSFIDITVASEGNVWIKNEVLDVEIKGDLRIRKNVSVWKITGQAEVKRGYYYYIDRKFTMETGYFTLLDSDKMINAVVDLTSFAKLKYNDIDGYKDATVFLNVSGSLEKPEINFYSDPELSTEEIISILSFNSSIASLREVGTLSKALPEKALQMYIRSNYLTALSSSIGLDQLSLETSLLSDEKSAKLSIGKYISRNLFISYTHDIFSFAGDLFKIEYSIGRNSQIITERDEEGKINAGFQFKLRY